MSACTPREQPPAAVGESADHAVEASGGKAMPLTDGHLITSDSMGEVRLGMTLGEAREILGSATLTRTSDGDGSALVEASLSKDDALILAGDEPDAGAPIDWSKPIRFIQTVSPTFRTADGVGPGSMVTDVVGVYGPIEEITLSEIEGRQHIRFAQQPRGLSFRLDYTGIFLSGESRTTRCEPGAKIFAVEIASY